MKDGIKLWICGGILVAIGLFAVYSTSIRKSFDQRLTVKVVQNIETVKAFNTFLDDTIIASTQKILDDIQEKATINAENDNEGENNVGETNAIIDESGIEELLPALDTLKVDENDTVKLVEQGTKKVQLRNNYVLFRSQVKNLIVALLAVAIVFFLPLEWIKNKKFIFLVTVAVAIFQICAFIPGLAATNGEARGWVDLGPLPNMQPAEFFKLGYVFFMSYWLTKRKDKVDSKEFLIQFSVINAIVLLVILCIPDMGTLFILALTGTIMARYMGLSIKKIILLGCVATGLAAFAISTISMINPDNYALHRLTTFVTRDEASRKKIEKQDGWQIQQGLIAVGAGGVFGQGYGKGLQKMGQLPEAYSDMIFAAFSEEIGFVGNLAIFALYIFMFVIVLRHIPSLRDIQMKVLAIGIISLIIVQVFVHVGVNLDILPNTGLTLPFISHGGTALLINFIELTLLYKILELGKTKVAESD